MKKIAGYIVAGAASFILGGVLAVVILMSIAPSMMIIEDQSPYDFETTVSMLKKSIEDNNWKIPAVHDLQKTMKKYNKDVLPVQVFELCHPEHAGTLLKESDERIVSSMMPCRVAVYEKEDGTVYISRLNSGMMAGMLGGLIAEVMKNASSENEEILSPILKK
jgi:uncharacterized protein (DUF302 family)